MSNIMIVNRYNGGGNNTSDAIDRINRKSKYKNMQNAALKNLYFYFLYYRWGVHVVDRQKESEAQKGLLETTSDDFMWNRRADWWGRSGWLRTISF